jgi:type I restriction enzyme S subunit
MKAWQSGKIEALPIQIIDGDRSAKYPKRDEFQEDGFLFLNTTNIEDNRLTLHQANFVSAEKFEQIRKGRLRRFDVVMTTRGSIGKVALFNCAYPTGLINAQMLILRADGKIFDPRFLFYVFRSEGFQKTLRNFASGSAQPQIPMQDLRAIEITYPLLPVQRAIAATLSAYDDLIENNRRRIKILEEMAQAIYREWFVHFRFPGHKKVKLVPSPLGPIPERWSIKKATDAIGIDPQTKVPKDGEKPFVPMSSLSNDSMLIGDIESRSGNSGSKFKNGDTLFARITPCLENGKTAYVQFLPTVEDVAFGSTEFIVLRSATLCPEFVYLLARSPEFRGNAIKSMSGATGRQRVQPACFDKFLFVHPDKKTIAVFAEQVSPIFHGIQLLARKNANLRATRDLLLPKLISGELDVSDLDIRMEGVV